MFFLSLVDHFFPDKLVTCGVTMGSSQCPCLSIEGLLLPVCLLLVSFYKRVQQTDQTHQNLAVWGCRQGLNTEVFPVSPTIPNMLLLHDRWSCELQKMEILRCHFAFYASIYKHEVVCKGRNVVYPILQVLLHLASWTAATGGLKEDSLFSPGLWWAPSLPQSSHGFRLCEFFTKESNQSD